jgi:hypothetical protein
MSFFGLKAPEMDVLRLGTFEKTEKNMLNFDVFLLNLYGGGGGQIKMEKGKGKKRGSACQPVSWLKRYAFLRNTLIFALGARFSSV